MAVTQQQQTDFTELPPEEMAMQMMNPDIWRGFAANFTVEGETEPHVLKFTKEQEKDMLAKLDREAYVHVKQPGLNSNLEEMRNLLAKITGNGLPPVFAFAYDEFWNIHLQMRSLLKIMLEDDEFSMLPDFWCWRVEPNEAGWRPHRDKVKGCMFPNGKPKSLTVWVPLSIAHPLNGCMYMVPADRDPLYYKDGTNGFAAELSDIRALPAEAGDIMVWTQRVMHWGSHSADWHDLPPRQSVAFEYQRCDIPAFNSPLLDPDTIPSFEGRMGLIAKQILQYTHMYDFTEELEKVARTILDEFGLPEPSGKSVEAA